MELFHAYNRVMWEHFPYCHACGGQCCVVDASDVRTFDLLAMALLGETPPILPERINAGRRSCIYLTTADGRPHCSWPARWRTIKCWSFYCLGSKPLANGTDVAESYRALTSALTAVVEARLPEPLRRYERLTNETLSARLEDPVDFSNALHRALAAIFVDPFLKCYAISNPLAEPQAAMPNLTLLEDDVAGFIAAALAELGEESDNPTVALPLQEQLWDDLATLAWIVESRPATARRQLRELEQRIAQVSGFDLGRRTHQQILQLLAIW
jgi:hypothetical protein